MYINIYIYIYIYVYIYIYMYMDTRVDISLMQRFLLGSAVLSFSYSLARVRRGVDNSTNASWSGAVDAKCVRGCV